ncbi:hypothetical protein BDV95DRAFT_505630 [Massariosphaeria phaeospora]|uniref:Uncharacterized protein n=1 Tax=Massariosphaeria phaeospora TaxID=100035 RepID=A0A7C8M7U4_9PLEO|nr:hypothetical protein BDV95DRAFT_505630 [Massariosphaeria phaeospora]
MRSLMLLFAFAVFRICQAFVSPDIYSFTQPATPSRDLGENSQPATVPSQSRHANGPASGLNIFIPDYQSDPDWLPLVLSLKTIGIQVRVIQNLDISPQCTTLIIYTPAGVDYSPSSAGIDTLTSFVSGGGSLLLMNQVPTALRTLAGVSAAVVAPAGSRSILQLTNTETTVQALQGFDFTDYYDISMPFYNNDTARGLSSVGYTPVDGSQTLGRYLVRSNGVDSADTSVTSAAIVKNQPSGSRGHVYSFGMDLGLLFIQAQNERGDYSQFYDGHYYPGYDIETRMIKNIVTFSSNFVTLWSVPYNKGLAFTTTWDIDTYISYPHGQGMAAAAMERGAAGNLNLHTKYITDTYESAYFQYGVPYIYQITGFRTAPDGYPYIDFGSHTVSHSPNTVAFPYGTLQEQFIQGSANGGGYAPYIHQCGSNSDGTPTNGQRCVKGGTSGLSFWTTGGTASGEVRVSGYLIRHLLNDVFGTNHNLTTYRPGNLAWNKFQASHCVANGFIGGSSCASNSHLTHLPFQVTHNRESFQELPYYEFPLQWSDGDGNMSSADFPGSDFRNQVNSIRKMAQYGGHYNILIHPSDAVFDKIQIQRALHDAVRPFAVFFNQTGIANWWTIRDRALVDITASSSTSVTMTVRLDGPVEGLTLQVPRTYSVQSATAPLSVCQQLSYDGFTNAVVLRNTARGLYTLTFSVGSSDSAASTCPDFTPQPISECVAWDVAIDDFLELYFSSNGINLLLLQTTTTGLSSNNVAGRLQLTGTTNNGVNSYYTEISRFCFDASLYTHMFFDMVAPAGVKFYVQLVSYDAACNVEQPSPTFLDVTSYAAADGQNHTVTIPLRDFAGQNMQYVRGLRIGNISPRQRPIYVDNIKLQKRCVTAPGDDSTQGLAIESFQNVDRWITGINDIFGATDTNNSMRFAKLSELGKMQLLPSDSSSFFFTSTAVGGVNLNAAAYSDVSLNVRGPSGGSFDVVVAYGSGDAVSTVNTNTYATLSPTDFVNVTIPLSAFSGLDTSSVSRITLRNFTPSGGSNANVFTVRWISLLGGAANGGAQSRCVAATGFVVFDFCDRTEFTRQTNALGAPLSDDRTMSYYNQTASGYINLVPRDASSYFYSLLAQPGACATVNSTYNAVRLTIAGPQGGTVDVGFKYGGASCNTNVVTSVVPITVNAGLTQVAIPFSRFPAGFNPANLQSFVMRNFNTPGSTYRLYSLVFVGRSDSPGCALCSGTLLNTCTFVSTLPRTNRLAGATTDEGSLTSYAVSSDGSLALGTNPDAYWYSEFGANGCYDARAVNATGIQLSLAAPAGTTFRVSLRWRTDTACTTTSAPASVAITDYVTFDGDTSYQVARIPFSDFPGVDTSKLNTVALSGFSSSNANVKVGCVSLVTIALAPPAATACTCPDNAWLNYCSTTGGTAGRNALGGSQSDDGSMRAPPAIVDRALTLQPAASGGSYWYSLLNCLDASGTTTLYLNITAPMAATFSVQLQTSGNACADGSQIQRASVANPMYGVMTGRPVLLGIPLAAFTAQNGGVGLGAVYAVVVQGFSDGGGTYTVHCAWFGNATAGAGAQMAARGVGGSVADHLRRHLFGRRG